MEQIKELLEILKETPEMALWGIGLYFGFMLLKMASWVGALTLTAKLFITRFFNTKDETIRLNELKELELIKNSEEKTKLTLASEISEYFNKRTISNIQRNEIIRLLDAIKSTTYIHDSDLSKAIKLIEESKKSKTKPVNS